MEDLWKRDHQITREHLPTFASAQRCMHNKGFLYSIFYNIIFFLQLVWPRKTSYDEFKGLCDKLGGKLPIITDNGVTSETLTSLVTASYAKLQALEQDYIQGDCNLGVNTSIIWLRQRKVDNLWTDPHDNTTSFKNFDIIDSHEKCAYVFGNRIEPAACLQNYACGLCYLPPGKLLKMKGLCKEDILEKFDTDYYIFGAKNSLPHFRYFFAYMFP